MTSRNGNSTWSCNQKNWKSNWKIRPPQIKRRKNEEKMLWRVFNSENTSICTKHFIRTEKNFLYLFLKDDWTWCIVTSLENNWYCSMYPQDFATLIRSLNESWLFLVVVIFLNHVLDSSSNKERQHLKCGSNASKV